MTAARWKLPAMTDPLGKHWAQPGGLRDRVRLHRDHAVIAAQDWEGLPRYETTTPSGVYAGKAWRSGPFLCWFGPERAGVCAIGMLRAVIAAPPPVFPGRGDAIRDRPGVG